MLDLGTDLTEKQQIDLEPLRYVCWTGEGLHPADVLHLGDHVNRIAAEDPRPEHLLINAIAHYIDATPLKVRLCTQIASFLDTARMRAAVTGEVFVCFTVLRALACNHERSPLTERQRWRTLERLMKAPAARTSGRVTSTAYRKAIHGYPIPNSTHTITPAHVYRLISRSEDFRQAAMDALNSRPEWVRAQAARRRRTLTTTGQNGR
ncbi:hypothetical protein [Streptomyces violaceusniger]|uniref:Uncharacterized protein n=1 Tax=Streptomyces violaceusniger (strain Tu 4113) TaxID=653045 RepID=G2PHX6_STRV4|nr:hypothetical protein [Streptomyces violaceusniger]AEM88927.1 hypothetical protein Strvi_0152 [Streptomyces violaceusniger Tu 4113]